ncbi:MAG: hypothetical protein ACI8SA_001333, partial [Dokdonia sp.]
GVIYEQKTIQWRKLQGEVKFNLILLHLSCPKKITF